MKKLILLLTYVQSACLLNTGNHWQHEHRSSPSLSMITLVYSGSVSVKFQHTWLRTFNKIDKAIKYILIQDTFKWNQTCNYSVMYTTVFKRYTTKLPLSFYLHVLQPYSKFWLNETTRTFPGKLEINESFKTPAQIVMVAFLFLLPLLSIIHTNTRLSMTNIFSIRYSLKTVYRPS